MRLRPLVLSCLVLGVGLGTAVAVADDPGTATPVTGPPRIAPLQPTISPLHALGVHEVLRREDPAGGAPWVVRAFTTTEHGKPLRCLQLGREVDGRFGWAAAGADFEVVRPTYSTAPLQCLRPGRSAFRVGPALQRTSVLDDASDGVAAVARSVVWGQLAHGTTRVEVRGLGRLMPGAEEVVLDVRAGGRLGGFLEGTTHAKDGQAEKFGGGRRTEPGLRPGARPVAGTTAVAARTPDPAGGPAWGILTARALGGGTCTSAPGRLVGDQLATLGLEPGTAFLAPFDASPTCRRPKDQPSARKPVRLDVALFSYPDADPAATGALRRLTGRTVLVVRALPAVRTVTITTSRGVRTLVPDPRTHVTLDVYDGTFPGEDVRVTGRLASKRTATIVQSAGG